jgi:hypothetical protein
VSPSRRISFAFGVLFLITFITSIPALLLFQPVLDDPVGYVASGGSDNRIFFGAFLELLLIIANIGTAVVVYPLLKRQNHILALGYVTARIFEIIFILVGILAVLSIVSLSQESAGGEEGAIAYIARGAQGLDVPPRAWLGRGLGKRAHPRLSDVPLGARATMAGDVRARRRPADHPLGHARDVRRRPPERPAAGPRDHPRVHLGVGARHLRDRLGIQGVPYRRVV